MDFIINANSSVSGGNEDDGAKSRLDILPKAILPLFGSIPVEQPDRPPVDPALQNLGASELQRGVLGERLRVVPSLQVS